MWGMLSPMYSMHLHKLGSPIYMQQAVDVISQLWMEYGPGIISANDIVECHITDYNWYECSTQQNGF
jgi:hypothetical protein